MSRVNDAGFWLVGRLIRMDDATTLKMWTLMETANAVVGFAVARAVFGVTDLMA